MNLDFKQYITRLSTDHSMDGTESELSPAHRAAADGDMDVLTHAIQTDPVLLECTDAEGEVLLSFVTVSLNVSLKGALCHRMCHLKGGCCH